MGIGQMEIKIGVTHVAKDGDRPVELSFDNINQNETVNMNLNGEHYRMNLKELDKIIKALS